MDARGETFQNAVKIEHLDDKMETRFIYPALPETDIEHLKSDSRFHSPLIYQWLNSCASSAEKLPLSLFTSSQDTIFQSKSRAAIG